MGYILLGHGTLNLDPGVINPGMEYVAVPLGTTIQFYNDLGQGLVYGSADLDIWEQLEAPWPAITSARVTYNLSLANAKELWDDELANDPQFGGHELIRAGVDGVADPILLCTGTPATCPTDPRAAQSGETHDCDGILGTYEGDLYWLACSTFKSSHRQLENMILAGRSSDVEIGVDPDWIPGEDDQEALATVNKRNVDDADDEDDLDYVIGGFALLIGDGHDSTYDQYANHQTDAVEGTLTVHKGGTFSTGHLDFQGVPLTKQGLVESSVERFSKKEVRFV